VIAGIARHREADTQYPSITGDNQELPNSWAYDTRRKRGVESPITAMTCDLGDSGDYVMLTSS
jgi:hypothetical protein